MIELPAAPAAAGLRDVTGEDLAAWSRLQSEPLLTPDGQWLVYLWSGYDDSAGKRRRTATQLIMRSTGNGTERRLSLGALPRGAAQVKISPSGRWIAFATAGAADRAMISAMEVSSGRTLQLQEAAEFQFGPAGEWLALRGYPDRQQRYDLSLYPLNARGGIDQRRWRGVAEFVFDPSGRRVAFIDESGVHWMELSSGSMHTLQGLPGSASRALRWSPRGRSLALLSAEDAARLIVIATGLGTVAERIQKFDPVGWAGFPADFQVSDNPVGASHSVLGGQLLRWREQEDGVFFEIEPVPAPEPAAVDALILWHSRDPQLPALKALDALTGVRDRLLCMASVPEGRFVQLARGNFDTVIPQGRGRFALAYDWRSYGTANYRTLLQGGLQLRDYAVINLENGERRDLVRALQVNMVGYAHSGNVDGHVADLVSPLSSLAQPRLSPDGEFFFYLDNAAAYQAIELATGQRRAASAGLTHFNKRGYSPGSMNVLQGWSEGWRDALVSDGYDIWALPLKGGRPRNLTGDGRARGIEYTLKTFGGGDDALDADTDTDRSTVSLDAPLFFRAWDTAALRTGLARRLPGAAQAQVLRWQDAASVYSRARQAEVYISAQTTAMEGTDYYLFDRDWQPRRLTDLSPQRRLFHWPPPPQHLRFRTARGEPLDAILYLPIGAQAGQKYPTLVDVYELITAARLHREITPDAELFRWLRDGYAVLHPDIRPRVGEPGASAVEAVTAAIDAAVATGGVDRDRLGLKGHSFGGYETNYIITQTHLFKAAVSLAGLSDLQSFYGATYGGIQRATMIDDGMQPYLNGPWWEHRDEYQRNSPLYSAGNIQTPLLLVHGDRDSSVDFFQSVELFNTLRRLGRSPVVLLQYVGERHGVPDLHDVQQRERQFFGRFLKDEPAPAWWSEGRSYYLGKAPAISAQDPPASARPDIKPTDVRTN